MDLGSSPPSHGGGAAKPVERPLTPTGFPQPYYAQRDTRSLLFRFLGLETTMELLSYRPGRKMIAFVTFSAILFGSVSYDRREAKRIRQSYIDRVRHLGDEVIDATDFVPRRVAVYSCKLPGDTEDERGLNWFKRYMKPILVAAGIDYTYTNGQIPGSLGRILIAKFKASRLEKEASTKAPHLYDSPEQSTSKRSLDEPSGGVVILGRTAWKEYLWALKRGYLDELDLEREWKILNTDLEEVEDQELMARFDQDGLFDQPETSAAESSFTEAGELPERSTLPSPISQRSSFKSLFPNFSQPQSETVTSSSQAVPSDLPGAKILPSAPVLPEQPPILLVPFSHPLGSAKWWPLKLYNWLFGERAKAELGGQLAFDLIHAPSVPLNAPSGLNRSALWSAEIELARQLTTEENKMIYQPSDDLFQAKATGWSILDFGLGTEKFIEKSFRRSPALIANHRKDYYKEMPSKIAKARKAEAGAMDLTPEEQSLTVADLYKDRLRQEKRWGREEQGWRVNRPGSGITWDERFDGQLSVYGTSDDARAGRHSETELSAS